MIKVTGLDRLTRQFDDARKALANLGTELGTVKINPHDPASIDAAIQQIEATADRRLGAYTSNPIIGPLADQMKVKYRQGIIDRAAAARLGGGENH